MRQLYKCEICGKIFATEYQLTNHTLKHANEEKPKIFVCEICGKTFLSKENLLAHKQNHIAGTENENVEI